ncbi:excinuclease ABC subunit C [Candidatus Pacearchaeota archaeon]|nr:excinuclease ABC subunit C [Candidatus Pacearchaeota archaeon]
MVNLTKIPNNPGCYLHKDKFGKIIYVGKAKNLKKRVNSYFNKIHEDAKTNALVSHIVKTDFIITDSEVEALILENNLIKKNKPKYNIDLKDSKRYAFIQITSEEFPRLIIARKREGKGKFFGPFVSGMSRDYVLEALKKIFKIRTCRKLPKRKCIRYDIGLCSAPCIKKISKEDYLESIKGCEMVLRGKTSQLVKTLTFKMKEFSRNQDFERALSTRNQIRAIKELGDKQKMERQKDYDEDIINWIIHDGIVHLMLFNSRKGILENKQDFEFDFKDDFLEEFLVQYYSENEIPQEIILLEKVDAVVKEFLEKTSKHKVKITMPQKGDKKNLLDLVKKNIEINLFGDSEKVEDLRIKLKLQEVPAVIECFDISHLSGTSTVASMVQFRNGKADKSNYRKYKIRTVSGIDDFASMEEVVHRRYSKLKNENLPMPNLIVVDGGKGQLSSSMQVLENLDLKVPLISLAKREEEVFVPGKSEPIILSKKSKALKLLQEIRNEAHRFAITYNRLLRIKKVRA